MIIQSAWQLSFDFLGSTPVVVEPSAAQISSDAGLLPFRQLGEGHPCTWRTRFIKVAARVFQTTRRVVVQLSSSWPYLEHFRQVAQRLCDIRQAAADSS